MIPKEVLQKIRRIEIKTKRVVDSILSGEYHSAFKGKGMEFSEVRCYTGVMISGILTGMSQPGWVSLR
jgi:hypothetical protein